MNCAPRALANARRPIFALCGKPLAPDQAKAAGLAFCFAVIEENVEQGTCGNTDLDTAYATRQRKFTGQFVEALLIVQATMMKYENPERCKDYGKSDKCTETVACSEYPQVSMRKMEVTMIESRWVCSKNGSSLSAFGGFRPQRK
jgi:hypothetical protein